MSVGSHPVIPARRAPWSLASRLHAIARPLRAAAAKSAFVRVVLISMAAMGVTAAGVAAGALVVAPVVAQADARGASTAFSTRLAAATTKAETVTRSAWRKLDNQTTVMLAALPEPVARYLLPSIAILSITGAIVALVLPPRRPRADAMRDARNSVGSDRQISWVTPTGSTKLASRKQRTPKAVEALAASGVSTPDIAWKTGLPIDAIRLLLAISSDRPALPHSV